MTCRVLAIALVIAGSFASWAASPAASQPLLLPMPDVQTAEVTFRDPVRVAGTLLMGRYVIEHDNERMARGEPCTHIYAADDRQVPVLRFHCTHLDRPAPPKNTVSLRRSSTYPIQELRAFQFAGDPAGHGVPDAR